MKKSVATKTAVKKVVEKAAEKKSIVHRKAFVYFVGKAALPEGPDGDAKVFKLLKSHKDGLTFRQLVASVKLPASTVDWARQRLTKAGAMTRRMMKVTA